MLFKARAEEIVLSFIKTYQTSDWMRPTDNEL